MGVPFCLVYNLVNVQYFISAESNADLADNNDNFKYFEGGIILFR